MCHQGRGRWAAVDVDLSGGTAVDGAGVAQAPGAGILCVLDEATLEAATPFVYPQLAPGALDGVVSNATSAYGAGKLRGVFQHVQPNTGDQELRLRHIHTQRPFFSMAAFHAFSLLLHCSSESAMITRSSAYKSSHGAPVRNSRERASSTRMNSSGLRTEPWCTPTATPNSSLYWPFTRTRLLALVYMPWMTLINHSSTPTLLRAHHSTFLGTRSKAFSRSTKAK